MVPQRKCLNLALATPPPRSVKKKNYGGAKIIKEPKVPFLKVPLPQHHAYNPNFPTLPLSAAMLNDIQEHDLFTMIYK